MMFPKKPFNLKIKETSCLYLVAFLLSCWNVVFADANIIFMDGRFDDWQNLSPSYQDTTGDQGVGNIDFGRIWVCNDAEKIYIRFEVGAEIILQESNKIYLFIDSDNNFNTGFKINGIGADFSIAFGERRGRYYGSITEFFNLNIIGLLMAPSVSSAQYEMAIPRDTDYNGVPVLTTPTIRLCFENRITGSHDIAPNSGQTLNYNFDETPLPSYSHIPLSKEESLDIRILSYNVWNDGLFSRSANFMRILRAIQPDILNFQEIYDHTAEETRSLITTMLPPGPWYAAKVPPDCVTVSKYPILQNWDIVGNLALLIDLPSGSYAKDLCIINAHLPAGGDNAGRQQECDAIMAFIRDLLTPGGVYDLPANTPILIAGDLNLVGYAQQLTTLLTGDIVDEATYGSDFLPDWDSTPITDVLAYHTATRNAFTWRREASDFTPGRLDYIIYSDSVINLGRNYLLATEEMTTAELSAAGLQADDTLNASDHLPVVSDFRLPPTRVNDFLLF